MYTVFSPVVSRRPNDNTFVRWDRGITVKSKKTLNNTIFTKSVEEQLDIEKFLGERDIYDAMNTPYRRGYCLYGPPGTGKTTAIAAVANQFNLDVFRINLNIIPSDYHFDQLISSIDSDDRVYILVFEDIDRTDFFKRLTNPEDNNGAKGISVGCLLNILDGLTGANGRITFFTLNDELALRSCDALFRPGRIDKKILVPYCDSNQVKRLFLSYFPTVDVDEEKIKIHISKISPAELTRIVYDNITSPQAVLNKIYSEKTKNE
jgi:chaperone BCS1